MLSSHAAIVSTTLLFFANEPSLSIRHANDHQVDSQFSHFDLNLALSRYFAVAQSLVNG